MSKKNKRRKAYEKARNVLRNNVKRGVAHQVRLRKDNAGGVLKAVGDYENKRAALRQRRVKLLGAIEEVKEHGVASNPKKLGL